LEDFFLRFGRSLVGREVIPVFVWILECLQEIMEGLEVSFLTSLESFLDLVVAGDDRRVDRFPEGEGGVQVFFSETPSPAGVPRLEAFG
jgi:hypothetical protein